jgi:hypothetical protein
MSQVQGVGAIVVLAGLDGAGHPGQIRAGAEHAAHTAQEHHTDALGAVQGLEGLAQAAMVSASKAFFFAARLIHTVTAPSGVLSR